jgi:hypothetical protein
MLELKSIAEEEAACLAAFEGVSLGQLVEFCHHDIPLERLLQPAKERIWYILLYKREIEIAKRLRYFRPHIEPLPEHLAQMDFDFKQAALEFERLSDLCNTEKKKHSAILEDSSQSCGDRLLLLERIRIYEKRVEQADQIAQNAWNDFSDDVIANFSLLVEEHNRLHPESPWERPNLFDKA